MRLLPKIGVLPLLSIAYCSASSYSVAGMSEDFHLVSVEEKLSLKRVGAADTSAVAVDFTAPTLNTEYQVQ